MEEGDGHSRGGIGGRPRTCEAARVALASKSVRVRTTRGLVVSWRRITGSCRSDLHVYTDSKRERWSMMAHPHRLAYVSRRILILRIALLHVFPPHQRGKNPCNNQGFGFQKSLRFTRFIFFFFWIFVYISSARNEIFSSNPFFQEVCCC